MQDEPERSFRLVSFNDDQPQEQPGALIPRPKQELTVGKDNNFHPFGLKPSFNFAPVVGFGFGALALLLLAIVGTAGFGLVSQGNLASAPSVTIVDPYTQEQATLSYGPQPALEQSSFFNETRDAFIDEGTTFIELDIASRQLRFFKRGVLLISAEIQSLGKPGSWWSVPAGLYEVEKLESRPYSNMAQVYFPHAVRFGGNYLIHGAPEYPDGSEASIDRQLGGIRLSNQTAAHLYSVVARGMPILVHTPSAQSDSFIYEPQVPGVTAPYYLVADVNNGTILATKKLNEPAPIASVVKLMTAVVASEEIDLDTRVRSTAPTFVESLIPRLADRRSVSMYSLLQLLLVESSNEAAEVIAAQVGRENFIEKMNDKAKEIGMRHSWFTDPSGLDAENMASVGDLFTLARYIHEQRSFIFDITDTTRVSTDYVGGEFGDLVNFNRIEDIDSFVGGKVGETNAAGQTSVSLHSLEIQGEERLVVVVVLGSTSRSEDVQALLSHVEQVFPD